MVPPIPGLRICCVCMCVLVYKYKYTYLFFCPALSCQPNRLGKLAEQVLWDKSGCLLIWLLLGPCVCLLFTLHDI